MSLTPAQEETMKRICMNIVTNFMALPEDVQAKYNADEGANAGKAPHETEQFLKTKEVFAACDADKDGLLNMAELAEYVKAFDAWCADKYGAAIPTSDGDAKDWKEIACSLSEPHTGASLDDMLKMMEYDQKYMPTE